MPKKLECQTKSPHLKGLYRGARRRLMKDFAGVDAVYKPPMRPNMLITTTEKTAAEAAWDMFVTLRQLNPDCRIHEVNSR